MNVEDMSQPRKRRITGLAFREAVDGYTFATPAILGLLVFTLGPVLVSLYFSFTNYDIVSAPQYVGAANYIKMLADDGLFRKSLWITVYYCVTSIPLVVIVAFLIAVLMNQKVRGITVYRVIWYIPSLVPAVCNATLWRWVLNRDFGLLNIFLRTFGIDGPGWLIEPNWTIPSLVMIRLWGIGSTALIFLGGLQGIPEHLYEAVDIDGGTWWHKFRHITIPMVSPIIFFNLIMSIISSFQVFTLAYVIFTPTGGTGSAGPENAALFYVLYLYRNAFQYFKMGYASAMAWFLCLVIMALTALVFKLSGRWVYYEASRAR